MTETVHPNLALLGQLDLRNPAAWQGLLSDDFVWHYFNPKLPDLEGDYRGAAGLQDFFARLEEKSAGTFRIDVVDVRPAGDELVLAQVCNSMHFEGHAMEFDAVVVWRIVNGRISEAWDIPAIHTTRSAQRG